MLGDLSPSTIPVPGKFVYDIDGLLELYLPLFHIFPVELIALIHSFFPDRRSDLSERGLIPRICESVFEHLQEHHFGLFDGFPTFISFTFS